MLIHQACTAKLFALKCTDNHYNNIGDRKQIVSGMSIKHNTLMCIITKIRINTIIYKKNDHTVCDVPCRDFRVSFYCKLYSNN